MKRVVIPTSRAIAASKQLAASISHLRMPTALLPLTGWRSFTEGLQDADIVLGRLLYPSPTPAFLRAYEHYYHTKLAYLLNQKLNEYYYGHAGNMAVRAAVFEVIGPFPNMPVVGDTEIIHRLLDHNPQAFISYRAEAQVVHDGSAPFPAMFV